MNRSLFINLVTQFKERSHGVIDRMDRQDGDFIREFEIFRNISHKTIPSAGDDIYMPLQFDREILELLGKQRKIRKDRTEITGIGKDGMRSVELFETELLPDLIDDFDGDRFQRHGRYSKRSPSQEQEIFLEKERGTDERRGQSEKIV